MATNNSVNVGLTGSTGTVHFVGSTSPTLVTPVLGAASGTSLALSDTGILDVNGNSMLTLNPASSPVNYIQIGNAATLNPPGVIATGSDTNIQLQLQGQGNGGVEIQGISSGANKPAGYVGQIITNTASTQAISNDSFLNVTSINLTAGLWLINAGVLTNPAAGTIQSEVACGINTNATAALPTFFASLPAFAAGITAGLSAPSVLVNISSTTTYYIVAIVGYSVSTLTISATISGVRIA